MERYFDSVDRHPRENINNLRGWYNRAKSYYSNSKLFSSNLIQNSDWAKTHHTAEVYTFQAEGLVYALMEDTLKEYIKELRYECIEKDELKN